MVCCRLAVKALQSAIVLRELCLRVRKGDTVSIIRCSAVSKLISEEVLLTLLYLFPMSLVTRVAGYQDWKTLEKISNEGNPPADIGIDALPTVEISELLLFYVVCGCLLIWLHFCWLFLVSVCPFIWCACLLSIPQSFSAVCLTVPCRVISLFVQY